MALGMLKPFNAGAQAATILKDRNPGALQVAMGRNNAEDKMAQKMLAAKVAAKGAVDKQKEVNKGEAAKNILALSKENVFRYHATEFAKRRNNYIDEYAKASMLHAQDPKNYSDPDDPGTEAGAWNYKMLGDLNQLAKSSKDIQDGYEKDIPYITAHKEDFYPGALQEAEAAYADPNNLINNTAVEKPAHLWNIEKNLATTFAPMEDMVTAWASPTGDGGVASGSLSRPIPGAIKHEAEVFSSGEWAYPALTKRFAAMEPLAQERIKKIAKANDMSIPAALTMDMATNLYGATKQEAGLTGPSSVGRGMQKENAQAREIFEVWKGTVEGTHAKYKDVKSALPDVSNTQFKAILKNNPQLETFFERKPSANGLEYTLELKPGFSLLKDFNKYTIGKEDEKSTEDGKIYANPVKPVLVIQNDDNKSIMVVSGSDSKVKNGQVRISDPMSPSEVYSKLIVPAALNTKGYDVGALDLYTESQGVNIKGTNANINPANQPVQLLDRGGNPVAPKDVKKDPFAEPKKSLESIKKDPFQ